MRGGARGDVPLRQCLNSMTSLVSEMSVHSSPPSIASIHPFTSQRSSVPALKCMRWVTTFGFWGPRCVEHTDRLEHPHLSHRTGQQRSPCPLHGERREGKVSQLSQMIVSTRPPFNCLPAFHLRLPAGCCAGWRRPSQTHLTRRRFQMRSLLPS